MSRNIVFFRGFVIPEGLKVGSLKRPVRRHLGRWEMKRCMPLWCEANLEVKSVKNWGIRTIFGNWDVEKVWREAHFEIKIYETHRCRTTLGSWDVEKVDAVVARSIFWSQNIENTPGSDHFWKLRCRKNVARSTFRNQNVRNTPLSDYLWKLRCRKSGRRCGAKHILKSKYRKHTRFRPLWKLRYRKSARRYGGKHISKSKCTKHHMFAALLEVQISKKSTPLWREAYFEVKIYKTLGVWIICGGSDVASFASGH